MASYAKMVFCFFFLRMGYARQQVNSEVVCLFKCYLLGDVIFLQFLLVGLGTGL